MMSYMKISQSISVSEAIFQNAINAIELGVEDYTLSSQDPRRLHSAVRNLFAGILLLFKSKLADLSKNDDESLLKAKISPMLQDGALRWVGTGNKTVDYTQIKERFEALKINVNWLRLDNLHRYRNDIEHYFDKGGYKQAVVGQYIVNGFVIIHDFIPSHLGKNPRECFSEETWETFLKEKAIVEQEIRNRDLEFSKLVWFDPALCEILKSFHCTECGSNLINVVAEDREDNKASSATFECRECGVRYDYTELVRNFCDAMAEGRVMVKDDIAYDSIALCPVCGERCYDSVMELCYLCGNEGPHVCDRCGEPIPPSEMDTFEETNLCGNCAHMEERIMKDD